MDAFRDFVARILGWSPSRADAVEHAIRSINLAVERSAALVLLGDTDLVPIAHALHRRTLGTDAPFVVCDVRRTDIEATVRSPANYTNGVAGFKAATGGTLCLRYPQVPDEFRSMIPLARSLSTSVQLMLCGDARFDTHPLLVQPVPIRVPSLVTRTEEIPRIVDEYGHDAIAELRANDPRPRAVRFTADDRAWVLDHSPLTLPEIEKTALRLVAIKMSENLHRAADRLGMAPVSLLRWIGRRTLPPMSPEERAELDRDLEQSFVDEEEGRLIDADDALADLRAKPSDQDEKQ